MALRRRDSGRWGDDMCSVVTANKQFAPTLVSPDYLITNSAAWARSIDVAMDAEDNWALPPGERNEIVPGASHFVALALASPSWRNAYRVAEIGDHTFLRVEDLKPRKS